MPLELKQQRILPAKIGKVLYRYVVRPITGEEWLKYFDSVVYEQQQEGDSIVNLSENTAARIELLEKVLVKAEGYPEVDPDRPLTSIKDWPALLPLGHRAAFADLLFQCGTDLLADTPVMLGSEAVTLRARWSEDPSGKGLAEYGGLQHVFNMPSLEHQRRYSRDSSRSRVTGGRKGKTLFLGAQRTLAALYDELIVSVDGYTADGEPLNNRKDLIVASMDTFHKVQAMGQVFAPVAAPAEDEE